MSTHIDSHSKVLESDQHWWYHHKYPNRALVAILIFGIEMYGLPQNDASVFSLIHLGLWNHKLRHQATAPWPNQLQLSGVALHHLSIPPVARTPVVPIGTGGPGGPGTGCQSCPRVQV